MKYIFGLVIATAITFSLNASAREDFIASWRTIYPDSNSDDITGGEGCQLCHLNSAGGAPWNSYGWAIRAEYRTDFNITRAINAVASNNSNDDADPSNATSVVEIDNHYQPGWSEGPVNTVRADGSTLTNQTPPSISTTSTKYDPAIPVTNSLPSIRNGNIVVGLETVADGFSNPVMAARAPGLPGFLFVVEQAGEIWRVDLSDGSSVLFHDVDAASGVSLSVGGERGLLGLAFDPDYLNNGYFYTYQSESIDGAPPADFPTIPNDHQTVISEWMTFNPASELNFSVSNTRRVMLRIDQPQSNHNGGMLNFGPDNYLYIALGDGGASDDVGLGHGLLGNSRDNTNPLGAILRIDPQGTNSTNTEYGIPNDNPFVAGGLAGDDDGLDEIYAYGFRNPYRFSFDSLCFDSGQSCNTLFVGDVGQNEVEEIDNVVSGGNYGWNWKEGSFFFYKPTSSIYNGNKYISLTAPPGLPTNLIDPVVEYKNSSADGQSAVGGYVYRGSEIPELTGLYVFADYFQRLYYINTNGVIRRFRMTSTVNFIAGFGEDHNNELYVLSRGSTGALQKLVSSELEVSDEICVPIKTSNGNIAVICL